MDKAIIARFFVSQGGNRPVRDWLMALDQDDRRIVGGDIAKVELTWPIGKPLVDAIGGSLWEVRSTIASGKVEARVVFGIDGAEMILLHGFPKDPKRQDHEFKVAADRWAEYKAAKPKPKLKGKGKR